MYQKMRYEFVILKKYYTPKELAIQKSVPTKQVVYEAALLGALHRINGISLINRKVFETRHIELADHLHNREGRYVLLQEVLPEFGLSSDIVVQMASDADALIAYGRHFFVDVEELEKFLRDIHMKVQILDVNKLVDD